MDIQVVTTPSVAASDLLFAAYKTFAQNDAATRDEFYTFLTTPSPERDVFLNENTEAEYAQVDHIVIKLVQ